MIDSGLAQDRRHLTPEKIVTGARLRRVTKSQTPARCSAALPPAHIFLPARAEKDMSRNSSGLMAESWRPSRQKVYTQTTQKRTESRKSGGLGHSEQRPDWEIGSVVLGTCILASTVSSASSPYTCRRRTSLLHSVQPRHPECLDSKAPTPPRVQHFSDTAGPVGIQA